MAANEYVVRIKGWHRHDEDGTLSEVDTWVRMRAFTVQDAVVQAVVEATASKMQDVTVASVRPFEEDAAGIERQVASQLESILRASRKTGGGS